MSGLKDKLHEWQQIEAQRKELSRQSATLGQRAKQLEEDFEAELKKSGKQSIKRHGFTLAWIAGRASVQWAAEFLKACGADEANRLKEEAAKSAEQKLSISVPSEE